ncbi:MAG: bifunctional methylenetetrahydrofolate dehydrogenase/methenyltetrahydrofolate cyclohydrolase FolD [Eubacteriales bacterium]
MGKIIDGKALAKKIKNDLASRIETLKAEKGIVPGLTVILVGNDPASETYVSAKHRDCNEVGIKSDVLRLPEETTQEELLTLIGKLNKDDSVHGLLVQLPVPAQIDEKAIIRAIDPKKDVDGFHVANAGALFVRDDGFIACTPKGIIELIKTTGVPISGQNAVVVGRSNIVGKPVAMLLLNENATVTICHSRTKNLQEVCANADILVAAIGIPEYFSGDYIKEGAIVIDVGTSKVAGKLKGDVMFEQAEKKAAYITPVPGGVGPMTRTMLLENTVLAAEMYG